MVPSNVLLDYMPGATDMRVMAEAIAGVGTPLEAILVRWHTWHRSYS